VPWHINRVRLLGVFEIYVIDDLDVRSQ